MTGSEFSRWGGYPDVILLKIKLNNILKKFRWEMVNTGKNCLILNGFCTAVTKEFTIIT